MDRSSDPYVRQASFNDTAFTESIKLNIDVKYNNDDNEMCKFRPCAKKQLNAFCYHYFAASIKLVREWS